MEKLIHELETIRSKEDFIAFNTLKIFGAKATVYLKYNGEIMDLTSTLSKKLILPNFFFETREEAPQDTYAMCEALGFEIWVEQSFLFKEFPFFIKIETEHSLHESFIDQMHDLSPWLARYISDICKIETYIPSH